jgi:hypothetical protein
VLSAAIPSISRQRSEPFAAWFQSPAEQSDFIERRQVIAWWETRRFQFNVYVGAVGIVAWLLVLIAGSASVERGVDFEEPLAMIFGPVVYAVLANVCYTFGWLADVVFYRGKARTWLYKSGVVFSMTITALPGLWAVVAWLMTLYTGKKFG